ncbi:hypothetical protein ACG04R_28325 [Roseateles sp. BYS78W]|uniref:Uncharacterized protein n=1 Tax=Pelomonas candidula TaxID=3299025 RepID=A0ABW7HKZ1_9BURK
MNDDLDYLTVRERRFLKIQSERLGECIASFNRPGSGLYGIFLSEAAYSQLGSIEFIRQLSSLRGVIITATGVDLAPLHDQALLEYIQIEQTESRLDISVFDNLKELRCYWGGDIVGLGRTSLRRLAIWKYGDRSTNDLTNLNLPSSLCSIELIQSRIESLNGLKDLPYLEEVSLHYLAQLKDIGALRHLPSLRYLHMEKCKSVASYQVLGLCSGLHIVDLESCAPIHDFMFLHNLSSLTELYFAGTKVDSLPNFANFGAHLKKVVGTSGRRIEF